MKKLIFLFLTAALVLSSCNKEPATEPNAQFETKLVDNMAYAGETFYIYLDNCDGEFFTLFQGLTTSTTYNADSVRTGTDVDLDTDSLAITYSKAGTYELTLVASSSGNWAEDYLTDVYTLEVVVIDSRASFSSMTVGDRDGVFTTENEILFYAHKLEDLTNERVKFITESSSAEVYIGDELTETGDRQDFSALDPGDDVGRTIVYTVKAPTGETDDYSAYFILTEPSSEKVLYGLSSSVLDAEFTVDEDSKTVTVSYYTGAGLSGKVLADASTGAVVMAGTKEIQEDANTVDFETVTTITVIAEDESEQDYSIVLYEKEFISAFSFTAYDPGTGSVALAPALNASVDFDAKTVDMKVTSDLDLSKVIASFEGLSNFTLKISKVVNDSEVVTSTLVSGVTEFDYSFDAVSDGEDPNTSKSFTLEVYDGSDLIDTYTLTVSL